MYYNGITTEEIKNICNFENVTLIEWNFNYWNYNCKYPHHAQLGQINHALYYFGKNLNEYMIFCDLDEYLNISNYKLKDFIKDNNQIDVFGFNNIWSDTVDGNIPIVLPNSIMVSKDKYNYTKRSKNIYKVNSISIITIHEPYSFSKDFKDIKKLIDLNMYHFYKWTNNSIRERVNANIICDKIFEIY